MLLQLDSQDPTARWVVYVFAVATLLATWDMIPKLPAFRFARPNDVGMTAYMCVVMLWFYAGLPISVVRPMFFADPAGAVVGKYLSGLKDKGFQNPIWWRTKSTQKSVGGSAAVFVFTVLTLTAPATLWQRIIVGILAMLAEAIGGAFDNLLLAMCVIGARISINYSLFGEFSLKCGADAWSLLEH